MNIASTIKEHPIATAGITIGGLILLLILMRSSAGATADTSNAGALQTIAAANAQQNQLAAQYGAQQSQVASANYQSSLAAQVQNNQVVAAANAATYQTDASLIAALASNQTQQQATQAQLAATAMQVNLQGQQNYLTADTVNQQTAAQLAAYGIQTDAQTHANDTAAAISMNQTNQNAAMFNAQIDSQNLQSTLENQAYIHQMDTTLQATEDTNAANLSAYQSGINYQSLIAQLQAVLTGQGIDAQKDVLLQQGTTQQQMQQLQYNYATQLAQNQYNINNQVVGMVGQAGLNHGTASLENSLTAILSGVLNQPQIGVAAEQSSQVASAASASMWSNIANAVASVGSTIAGGLFKPVASPLKTLSA